MIHTRQYALYGFLAVAITLVMGSFSYTRPELLTVTFLDVGQGDAVLIEAPGGNEVLIDGGEGRVALPVLADAMGYDRSIAVVIATHPDADHIGGLPDIFDMYEIDTFVWGGVEAETAVYDALGARVERERSQQVIARRGMVIDLGGGAIVTVLFPDRDVPGLNPNDASIIARLDYGETSFLFTGDAPQKIERYLTKLDSSELDVDVLKVGHHGSRTSTDDAFIRAVSPEFAIISAGADNSYGHPHEEVLKTLQSAGVGILRTDERGSIIIESDGEHLYLANETGGYTMEVTN